MINNNDSNMMKNKFADKKVYLLAAALSAALIGSQAPLMFVSAEAAEAATESSNYSSMIPDNVTIESPTELGNISLPNTEYGSLVWADSSDVPAKRVQSCEVILKPAAGKDMTGMAGWSDEAGGIVGYINVIVTSIDASSEQTQETAKAKTSEDEEATADEENNTDGVVIEIPEENPQKNPDDTNTDISNTENPKDVGNTEDNEKNETAETVENTEKTLIPSQETEETKSPLLTEIPSEEMKDPSAEIEEIAENTQTSDVNEENGGSILDISDNDIENSGENEEIGTDNIFDNPVLPAEDDRPIDVEEELSDEEKEERAQINHSYDGITVSGTNLPWYVQFRVSSGDEYQFENESDAAIFQSYEFELWDLQTDTEYEIPNGEYISVTVPVKEGYQYTIEHPLDNGATETIIPSVDGNTMVFSTHSFSPFGIAGSKQLVGPDAVNEEVTPTPAGNSASAVTPVGQTTPVSTSSDNAAVSDGTTGSGNVVGTPASTSDSTSSDNGNSAGDAQSADDSSKNQSAVKTGDSTAIAPFVVGLVVAAAVIIGVVVYMRRKKK